MSIPLSQFIFDIGETLPTAPIGIQSFTSGLPYTDANYPSPRAPRRECKCEQSLAHKKRRRPAPMDFQIFSRWTSQDRENLKVVLVGPR